MNWLSRLIVAATSIPVFGRALKSVFNRWDAAYTGWGERSWLFQTLQDAWLEISAQDREELQRIHESLIENAPIVQKIRSVNLQFSVGPSGLKVIPDSSDDGYNDARSVSWEKWWARPELGSDISGGQLTRVWAGLLFDKGEVIVHLTSDDVVTGTRSRKEPRLQTIDAHRLKTPAGYAADPRTGFPIIDGKVINPKTGAVVAYYIKRANYSNYITGTTQTLPEEFDRLDAANVIHKFRVLRPGQMRGIPKGVSGFNLVRDNMDLHKLEMQCAKICAEIAVVETNPAGELSTYTNRRQLLNIQTQNAAGAAVTKNATQNYSVSLGGKKFAMPTGSKLQDFMINRPTLVQQQYWDLHYTLICMAYDTAKLLVMPYSLQGTVTRADLDVCTNAFRVDFELIKEICEAVYAWQSKWALNSDLDFKPSNRAAEKFQKSHFVMDAKAPTDAHVCLIRPPRPPNVDIGYTAKALEIEMRLGVKVPQDVFADQGKDWRVQTRQMAEYLQFVKGLEKEYGLDPGQITSLTTPQPIEDPTSKPDAPEGDSKESSPENQHEAEVAA